MMRRMTLGMALAWILSAGVARADIIYTINLDTSLLIGSAAGPFLLNFQLIDGGGASGNNTVTLSNFAFGGGTPVGTPLYNGNVTGDLSSTVTLTDTDFFNDFLQGFDPGNLLQFTLTSTTNVDPGPTPDAFSFALTNDTFSFFDLFVMIDINSADPVVQTFASDPNFSPIGLDAPVATVVTAAPSIPVPSTLLLLGTGLALGLLRKIR